MEAAVWQTYNPFVCIFPSPFLVKKDVLRQTVGLVIAREAKIRNASGTGEQIASKFCAHYGLTVSMART
jgi:hypothetical protein